MSKFISRHKELEFLNNEYKKNSSSFIVLYGRRRIGKTTLTTEFGKDKNIIYFLATEESERENQNQFKNLVAEFINNELLRNVTTDNWEIIFKALVNDKPEEKKLIIIDEFQYLGKINAAFPSIFQRIWDTILKDKNIMVILCGSLISMMEAQTLAYSSPLYGRRTGQIKLKQIPFSDYHKFFQNKDRKELIEYYSVTGGVPKYIELFYDSTNVFSAIENNILSKQSFLYEEPIFLLQNEVSEVGSYFSIIKTIAAGNKKLAKISTALEVKQTNLTKYLQTLINLDILEREIPITEENPEKSKRGLYKIKDNFIEFWFKFVYPNKSFIEMGRTDFVINKIKNNLIDNHISYVYEDICIEEMWKMNAEDKWDFNFDKVGRFWNNTTEIDIVAFDSNGSDIIFGECKYKEQPLDVDVFYALLDKANDVEWKRGNRKEWYVFFSINGFTAKMQQLAQSRDDILLCT
ncbi:ATP-binding protein [Clostridium beijerinckii]|uniref:ATP-binding protein n=1 Tax=Clostridium beijerinckii TaxID=1520 RepID=UPI0012B1624F|nr:ATP-binding protein [Clostridium beijerinckii]MRY42731.1 AAA family ATPase [Parabacteroides distasonis]MZK52101.1 AAA family ATPase [Clostridium beijerinckii]MZK61278.1 AAA family ATPase [Clostridium beijerinckii]MZK71521.1 AAA family ATPase [Clostridium beijerinckii]MZK76880.1 AAA family ATPase [Clostridium beijerinckii]